MERLIQGLHQFREQVVGSHRRFFQQLAQGQSPSTLFITCSDSRINPNLMTQTVPGELFMLRNVGCIVPRYDEAHPSGEMAAVEYAIGVLHIRDVVVCGHSHCGAMSAIAHDTPLEGLPTLVHWLQHASATRRIIEDNYGHLTGEQRVKATVQENVLVQLENLRTHPCVKDALERGDLRLHGWVYKIETGEVFAYDVKSGQFMPLTGEGTHPRPSQATGEAAVTRASAPASARWADGG